MERTPPPWPRQLARAAVGCVLLNWALQNPALVGGWLAAAKDLLAPFAVGGALAFVANVPLCFLEQRMSALPRRLRRPMALAFLGLGLVTAGAVLTGGLAPQLAQAAASVKENLPRLWGGFWAWAESQRRRWPVLGRAFALREDQALWEGVQRQLEQQSGSLLGTTVDAAAGAIGALGDLAIGAVLAVYILAQKEALCHRLKQLLLAWLPRRAAQSFWKTAKLTAQTFENFLSGQCLEACILGGLFVPVLWFCHMPYSLLLSLIMGVSSLVPLVGPAAGCLAGALLIACEDPGRAAWFVVLVLALQQLEGNLIYPRVVGGKVGLPSLWVLAAVTLGGKLFGVAGMIVMIPLCAVLYTLLAGATLRRLEEKKAEEADPFAPGEKYAGNS
ncbi:MAG: AI-2E family transporter [Oscillospiraceae bacterium]|nr:AI-2E family transporter [Oscillospiraceae bacterium]